MCLKKTVIHRQNTRILRTQVNNENTSHENTKNTPQEDIVTIQEMALHLGLPPPEPLDLSGGNVSENWRKFKQKYTNYEIATRVNTKESATREATLLTVIGNNAIDVFNTLTWDAEGDDKKIDIVLQKFEENTVNQGKRSVTRDTSSFQEPKKIAKPFINM